jgi:phage terminase large subunit-like protein
VVTHGMTYASMSPAAKEVERLILARQLRHDGNEVMRWCLSNIATDQDAAGNIKPDKARSRDNGVTALCMAVGVAQANVGPSIHKSRPRFL